MRLYQSFGSIARSFLEYVFTQCNNVAKDQIAFWWCFSIMWYEGSNLGSADGYAIGVDIMPKQTPELRRLRVSFSHFVRRPRSHPLTHGLLNIWTELLSIIFSWSAHMRREIGTQITRPANYTLRVDFWTMIFYNLKNSSQDLSNEGQILFWVH